VIGKLGKTAKVAATRGAPKGYEMNIAPMERRALLFFIFAAMLNYTVWTMNGQSATNPDSLPTIHAHRLEHAVGGEGFPSAEDWRAAQPVHFDWDWRGENKDDQRATEVRLLWTPETLFIRFEARYRTITVYGDSRNDGWRYQLWEKDVAEAFLQPESGDPFEYQELEVAPNGLWIDLHISHGKNNELKSGLKRRASIDPEKKVWTAELAVPMKGLTDKSDASHPWRVNFFRVEGEQEPRFYSAWSPTKTEKPNFHVPAAFGYLVFEK
jgi:alpha-galactosidase